MPDGSSTQLLHLTLLGDAVDHAEVGILVFDDDRNIVATNKAYCELVGYGRDEVAKQQAPSVLPTATVRSVRGGTIRRKDGRLLPVRFSVLETTVSGLPYFVALVCEQDEVVT